MTKKIIRQSQYFVYIIRCNNGTFYTGYTNNLENRIKTHNAGHGSKYVRARLPATLVYAREYRYYKNALNAERAIKKMAKKQKEELIEDYQKMKSRSKKKSRKLFSILFLTGIFLSTSNFIWSQEMKNPDSQKNSKQYSKPSKEKLRSQLTPLQHQVTQEDGTERPFENDYWDNRREGIYVDVVSGEPLFSSRNKFKSGTGWPSFTQPLESSHIIEKEDKGLFMTRTEIRSKFADSHLGHVFRDGPPQKGLRYCINSAALRFIPKEELEKEGYGKYLKIFDK